MVSQAEFRWITVDNWASLVGKWEFEGNNGCYLPPGDETTHPIFGLAVNAERFRDGNIRCSMRFEARANDAIRGSAGIVLGYHPEPESYIVAGLGGFGDAYSFSEFVQGTGWTRRAGKGSVKNLVVNRDYLVEVSQKGQRISLVVDKVPVVEHLFSRPLAGNQLGCFVYESQTVRFREFEVQRKPPVAFVAMQFGEPFDTIYRTVLRPKAQQLGFEVVRIDEVTGPGIIFQDIQRKIEDATVVIAEITAPNQNVFYEVGYAHALNKPTILLAQRGKELPFDIRSYRVIFYDDTIGGKPAVDKTLREYLHAILQEV